MVDENKIDGAEAVKEEEAETKVVEKVVAAKEDAPTAEASEDKAAPAEEAPKDDSVADTAVAEGASEQSESAEVADEKVAVPRSSRHARHGVISGVVHVMATFNNTKVTITDRKGNVIAWRSAGRCGFKGSRKSTAYAATIVAQEAAREAASKGLREAEIRLNGPGAGRESAARAIHAARIKVTAIQDVTPIPHNGCRPPKRRRV